MLLTVSASPTIILSNLSMVVVPCNIFAVVLNVVVPLYVVVSLLTVALPTIKLSVLVVPYKTVEPVAACSTSSLSTYAAFPTTNREAVKLIIVVSP
jgi:hypothetical protein